MTRPERRRELAVQYEMERQELIFRQRNCLHLQCSIVRVDWATGLPTEIVCDGCEARNYFDRENQP